MNLGRKIVLYFIAACFVMLVLFPFIAFGPPSLAKAADPTKPSCDFVMALGIHPGGSILRCEIPPRWPGNLPKTCLVVIHNDGIGMDCD